MKRIKAIFASESPARSAGLAEKQAQEEGFICKCGKHIAWSKYVIAHWPESLQIKCPQCLRVFRARKGIVTEVSGPVKRVSKITGQPAAADPRKPLWRCYQMFHNGARPVIYQPVGDYTDTLDQANDLAWTYANKVEPNKREKREDLFNCLLRREEYPLLSTIEVDGLIVGSGDIEMIGIRKDEVRGCDVFEIGFRDPKGRITRIALIPEAFAAIMEGFEYRKKTNK